ncbi:MULTISPECIES: flagellar biosynthetic protein FliR [unclassified Nitratiruptor]|uniref:flagellar biosynthetic protein FliR n=1 Tax=unclassified Nitratiruptor TaxID=2624044 RepID=UPI001915A321|nr:MULTISPECIES: flagellar biosynthetic protein FliR [unclassified Nitratiruptor]BCD59933.1 flagellar biosynthetic protein FliR [Nitratiruptor sp. YY08-10]BCD63856.1 flagellar biosynthetic protein FliR [Nitratiruptor sp. YY08-14]
MSISLDQIYFAILVFFRVGAIFLSLPVLNANYIPNNIKLLLVLAFSFYLLQNLTIHYDFSKVTLMQFTLMILKEILLGFSIGLLVSIFVAAFTYAAEIISYFMGFTIVNVFDPTYGQVSILSRLFIMLFFILFFVTDVYHIFIISIVKSFEYIPLIQTSYPDSFFTYLFQKSGLIFSLSFQLAFPFALIVYLINLALALVNRLIPQINVFIVGLPLQIFVGIVALMIGAGVLVSVGVTYVQQMVENYFIFIKHLG